MGRSGTGSTGRRLRILLLADDHRSQATTIREHIDAFRTLSRHDVAVFNPRGARRAHLLRLSDYDVVVVHYSLFILADDYVAPWLRDEISRFDGLKVQYIQDDYRRVDEMSAMMRSLGIDILFTLVPDAERDNVWGAERLPGVRTITTYAGYVSEAAAAYRATPFEARPIDVGYRGRELPFWLGTLGQEKAWIAQGFLERAQATDLRCDIGWREDDRIYGKTWFDWLSSCRATLGTESGSTITDFDGTLQTRVEEYVRAHPDAGFSEVFAELLEPYEGNVRMNVVSPRIFEAAALRTGLVLFPGEYSGVIEADTHYVPLAKDFSNFDEVAARLRDASHMRAMIARTYEDIALSGDYSYGALVRQFDAAVEESSSRAPAPRAWRLRSRAARLERSARVTLLPSQTRGRVVAGHGGSWVDRVARGVGLARLVAGDLHTLRLAARATLWSTPEMRRHVTGDLARLAALRRAQRGLLNAGESYVIASELTHGVLLLRGVRPQIPIDSVGEDAHTLLASGAVAEIAWDHRDIGHTFLYALTRSWWIAFPVNERVGDSARYRFEALTALARDRPDAVAGALDTLVAGPELDPDTLTVVPRRLPLALHLLRHLDVYLPKAIATARLIGIDVDLLRIGALMLTNGKLRRQAGLRASIGDLAKLGLLRQARREVPHAGVTIGSRVEGATLVFETRAVADADSASVTTPPTQRLARDGVERIVWDHSSLGRTITTRSFPRVTFAVGAAGVHEFVLVSGLLERHRDAVLRALGDDT